MVNPFAEVARRYSPRQAELLASVYACLHVTAADHHDMPGSVSGQVEHALRVVRRITGVDLFPLHGGALFREPDDDETREHPLVLRDMAHDYLDNGADCASAEYA